ncbi:MAG: high-potential iron-sulfur protein [Caldimonas sp.]
MTSRRTFILGIPTLYAAAACERSLAADAAKLDPKDPQAMALGYVVDATKADRAKYPSYAAGQDCAKCALYQGKPGDAFGPCAIFAGRQVAAAGWCSAFAKKP